MKKIFYVAVAGVMACMGLTNCGNNVPAAKLDTEIDTVAYYFGLMNGYNMQNIDKEGSVFPETTLNMDNFMAGLFEGINADSATVAEKQQELNEYLNSFYQKMQQKAREAQQAKIAQEKAAGQEFMAENAKKEGVITLESGLQIQHVTVGTGKTPVESDQVKVDYKGNTIDGNVFDQGEDVTFPLNGVVKGFREALLNMKEGGKAIVTMPSDLAYGDRGAGQNIPGGATLQFELTLKEIVKK